MSFWGWLRQLFGRGQHQELATIREKLLLLTKESSTIAEDLKDIDSRRGVYMQSLRAAPTEQDARIWSQRLQGLDIEERGRKARWSQVGQEMNMHQAALANLKNIRGVNLKQLQRENERAVALQEQLAQQQSALAELNKEARIRQGAAQELYERATQQPSADPYMAMWPGARKSESDRPQGA